MAIELLAASTNLEVDGYQVKATKREGERRRKGKMEDYQERKKLKNGGRKKRYEVWCPKKDRERDHHKEHDRYHERSRDPNDRSDEVRTILIKIYDLHGGDDGITRARMVFDEMGERKRQRANVKLDQVVLIAVLLACAELGDLNLGRWIHSYVVDELCAKNKVVLISLINAIIHMYANYGLIDRAYEVFSVMPRRGQVIVWKLSLTRTEQGIQKEKGAWIG
ncbi:hypothetical protein SAY87_028711 [Trapa incisa]|uniref:Pentatricopeptide repeat-containing protein n=1 Tax=Trapa incisa TaxID=236973 RepID=A0AAN7L3B9_9MYRT|nr:hypothetical protein SAY87_028711 [Trapa incisa]